MIKNKVLAGDITVPIHKWGTVGSVPVDSVNHLLGKNVHKKSSVFFFFHQDL